MFLITALSSNGFSFIQLTKLEKQYSWFSRIIIIFDFLVNFLKLKKEMEGVNVESIYDKAY